MMVVVYCADKHIQMDKGVNTVEYNTTHTTISS